MKRARLNNTSGNQEVNKGKVKSRRSRNNVRKRQSESKEPLQFDQLEDRNLLAIDLIGGVLTITGTTGNDSAVVSAINTQTISPSLRTNLNGTIKDFLVSDVDRISFVGYSGDDSFTNNSAYLTVPGKPSSANGGPGNDTLVGSSGNDNFYGGPGNDIMRGRAGNDGYTFTNATAFENDTIYEGGSGGNDHIWFGAVTTPVTANLSLSGAFANIVQHSNRNVRAGDLSTAANIEYVTGGQANDFLTGNNIRNSLIGGLGNDVLDARGGNDVLNGGPGNDLLIGRTGNDVYVFANATSLENDQINEAASGGNDRLLFNAVTSSVTVDLSVTGNGATVASHTNRVLRTATSTTAANLEYVTGGSGNDNFTGNNSTNDLFGNGGNDVLNSLGGNDSVRGGSGDDLLIGGNGSNTLNGGSGNDIYRFTNTSPASTNNIVEATNGGMDSLDFRPVTSSVNMDSSTTNGILATYANRTVRMATGSAEVNVENIFGVQGRDRYIFDGADQTIAVLDSGIDFNHPALGGGFGSGFKVVGGFDFVDNDSNPDDVHGHGTFVAGIAAATTTGAPSSFYPVATASNLAAVRVLNANNQGSTADFIDGLQWVDDNYLTFANPITTVNISIGFTDNQGNPFNDTGFVNTIFSPLLASLKSKGIYVAVSAGNSYTSFNTPGVGIPASDVSVFPVASHTSSGQMSFFSQRADRALVALGTNPISTLNGGGFGNFGSGTSYAAPFVAGASALIREAYGAVGISGVTPNKLYNVMFDTADNINDNGDIYKKVNLDEALAAVVIDKYNPSGSGLSAPPSSSATIGPNSGIGLALSVNLSSTTDNYQLVEPVGADNQSSSNVTTGFAEAEPTLAGSQALVSGFQQVQNEDRSVGMITNADPRDAAFEGWDFEIGFGEGEEDDFWKSQLLARV